MLNLVLKDDRSEKVRYDFSEYPIYIRRALLSFYPHYAAPSHWHDDIELIAILSGEMKYHVNDETICLKAGEGIFVNARQIHYGFSDTLTECDFLCVMFHPMLLCTSSATEHEFVLPLIQNPSIPYIKITEKDDWKRHIFENIKIIYSEKDSFAAPIKIQSLLLSIWTDIIRNVPKSIEKSLRSNNNLTILKNMIGFIQKNYQEKLSLSDIAYAGAVGQSKCCKLFGEYFNQTPITYLNCYRLNKGMELLCNTDRSISEIALEVGFGGASYFSETFRKWLGQSPMAYRMHRSLH